MRNAKYSASALAVTLTLSVCGLARAQDEDDGAAADGKATESDAKDENAEPGDDADEAAGSGRFRFGVSGMGGPMLGAFSGGAGGVDLRFGWQLNNSYGIYAQPLFAVAAGAAADNSTASASAAVLAGTGALFEWNPINLVYLAGGVEILSGAFGSASVDANGGSAKAATGPFFSIPLRAGLALGSNQPNRRKAFTIGLDGHIIITGEGPVILPLIALGYDAF